MNIENAKALREHEQGRELDMEGFARSSSGRYILPDICMIAGCHAGWECHRIGDFKLKGGGAWTTAKESLELTDNQAGFLFLEASHFRTEDEDWNDDRDVCGVKEAQTRLDYLIENGDCPPSGKWSDWAMSNTA